MVGCAELARHRSRKAAGNCLCGFDSHPHRQQFQVSLFWFKIAYKGHFNDNIKLNCILREYCLREVEFFKTLC